MDGNKKRTLNFTYEMADNGFILSDECNSVKQVFEDKLSESEDGIYHYSRERHEKQIGMWVYEEMDEFMKSNETCECEVELTIRPIHREIKQKEIKN
jgi:hypothetical protein